MTQPTPPNNMLLCYPDSPLGDRDAIGKAKSSPKISPERIRSALNKILPGTSREAVLAKRQHICIAKMHLRRSTFCGYVLMDRPEAAFDIMPEDYPYTEEQVFAACSEIEQATRRSRQ